MSSFQSAQGLVVFKGLTTDFDRAIVYVDQRLDKLARSPSKRTIIDVSKNGEVIEEQIEGVEQRIDEASQTAAESIDENMTPVLKDVGDKAGKGADNFATKWITSSKKAQKAVKGFTQSITGIASTAFFIQGAAQMVIDTGVAMYDFQQQLMNGKQPAEDFINALDPGDAPSDNLAKVRSRVQEVKAELGRSMENTFYWGGRLQGTIEEELKLLEQRQAFLELATKKERERNELAAKRNKYEEDKKKAEAAAAEKQKRDDEEAKDRVNKLVEDMTSTEKSFLSPEESIVAEWSEKMGEIEKVEQYATKRGWNFRAREMRQFYSEVRDRRLKELKDSQAQSSQRVGLAELGQSLEGRGAVRVTPRATRTPYEREIQSLLTMVEKHLRVTATKVGTARVSD